MRQLDDQLGQIGFNRRNAEFSQGIIQVDLIGGERLDLDNLFGSVALDDFADDAVSLGPITCPVDLPAGAGH